MFENNELGDITMSHFKDFYDMNIKIKIVWCCWGIRHRDQQNKIEKTEIDMQKTCQIIFGTETKKFNEEQIVFQ